MSRSIPTASMLLMSENDRHVIIGERGSVLPLPGCGA
jgi:uncharacterized protein with ACT and thioredoxin-like domain